MYGVWHKGAPMDMLTHISQLLQEGRDWEARELFFQEEFIAFLQNMHTAVNSMIKDPKPMPDLEVLWERMREKFKP
jgi:hypothetical protein